MYPAISTKHSSRLLLSSWSGTTSRPAGIAHRADHRSENRFDDRPDHRSDDRPGTGRISLRTACLTASGNYLRATAAASLQSSFGERARPPHRAPAQACAFHPLRAALAILLGSLLTASAARAGWSSDPSTNLAIADAGAGQTIPLVTSTSDGGVYVAWFDNPAGNYNVYLQRLSPSGVEQWPHNGILISDHPQNTALFGWDMITDSHDNAVLVFSDQRTGSDLDVYAYKISPTGQFLWGPDGVTLSDNSEFEPAPHVAEASDGDFVFVWQRGRAGTGDGDIHMQRVSSAGALRFAYGGIPVVTESGRDPGFVNLAPSDAGSVILIWLRDIRTFASQRHIRAQRFSAAGAPVWGSILQVYDLFSVPIGYAPKILSDGGGGAIVYWHRSDGSLFNSFVQHIKSEGSELLPHEGLAVATTPGVYHIDPTLSFDPVSGDMYVFWNERNTFQSQWGIYGQKIPPGGTRAWGDGGIAFLPVDSQYKSFPRSVPTPGGGAIVVIGDSPSGQSTDRLIALRVDSNGTQVWPGPPLLVASAGNGKSRYPVTIAASGSAKVVWEDARNATVDVYGQNINPDGTLGLPAGAGRADSLIVRRSVTPGDLTLSWTPSCPLGAVDYAIYEGTLGTYYSHVMKDCADQGGDRTEDIHPAVNNTYYLVVPYGASAEGSYGKNSLGIERPPAVPSQRCVPAQVIAPCP